MRYGRRHLHHAHQLGRTVSNPQKAQGSRAECLVRDFLIACGVRCQRIPSGAFLDEGDIFVSDPRWPSIDVKDHAAFQPRWLDRAQEQRTHSGRLFGVVWHKRRGKGNPAEWFVTMLGSDFVTLMENQK